MSQLRQQRAAWPELGMAQGGSFEFTFHAKAKSDPESQVLILAFSPARRSSSLQVGNLSLVEWSLYGASPVAPAGLYPRLSVPQRA